MRRLARRHLFGSSCHHHFAARVTSFGAEIDHVIRGLDHVQVMLDQ
jgi:hypothetical protein